MDKQNGSTYLGDYMYCKPGEPTSLHKLECMINPFVSTGSAADTTFVDYRNCSKSVVKGELEE